MKRKLPKMSRRTWLWILVGACSLAGWLAGIVEQWARDRMDHPPDKDKPKDDREG